VAISNDAYVEKYVSTKASYMTVRKPLTRWVPGPMGLTGYLWAKTHGDDIFMSTPWGQIIVAINVNPMDDTNSSTPWVHIRLAITVNPLGDTMPSTPWG